MQHTPPYVDGDISTSNRVTALWLNEVNAHLLSTSAVAAKNFFAITPGGYSGNLTATGDQNSALGSGTLAANTTGRNNNAVGRLALTSNTTGQQNNAFGVQALTANTTGINNTAAGNGALAANTIGSSNTAVGVDCLRMSASGSSNTAIGVSALQVLAAGGSNTAFGIGTLLNTLGSNNTAFGAFAGRYETGSNTFYVDALDRTNTAGDIAGALLYGNFNAVPANQHLRINAVTVQPLQPAFAATGSAQSNITGDGTEATLTWTTVYDQSTAFDTTNFTAPVTGKYTFSVIASFSALAGGNTVLLISLVTTGRTIVLKQINSANVFTAGGEYLDGGTVDVEMTASDTAHVTVRVDGGTKIVDMKVNGSFSGRLVC